MNDEFAALGREINWDKTKIQASDIIVNIPSDVIILGQSRGSWFLSLLGFSVDASGGNGIWRSTELVHSCTNAIDHAVWLLQFHFPRSSDSKMDISFLPVIMWFRHLEWDRTDETMPWLPRSVVSVLVLRVPYTANFSNITICLQTNQPPVSWIIKQYHLKLFGHIVRATSTEDQTHKLQASSDCLPADRCRPRGQPRQSWLYKIKCELELFNLGLHSALRRAEDRLSWRGIVELAMLSKCAT